MVSIVRFRYSSDSYYSGPIRQGIKVGERGAGLFMVDAVALSMAGLRQAVPEDFLKEGDHVRDPLSLSGKIQAGGRHGEGEGSA
jgi:hypothetical protein